MSEESYEEYKKLRAKNEKRKEGLHNGKICVVVGLCLLLYSLYMLPHRADSVHQMRGSEIKAAKEYYPEKAYTIETLEILEAKTETDGRIYAIARFLDGEQKDWIVLLTPGRDERLAENLSLLERSQKNGSGGNELTVRGCFLMRMMEDLPFSADSYYTVYGEKYANENKSNMPAWNAEYLCVIDDNYTLRALCRPGIPLCGFAAGLGGILYGAVSLIRSRGRREEGAEIV